jgi:hypothetical protein
MQTQTTGIPWLHDEDFAFDGELILACPTCNDEYQHHQHVEVFERLGGEDGPTVVLSRGEMRASDANPSGRRNALRVHFYGECGHAWYLDISQHKGRTFISANQNGSTPDSW